MKLYGKNSNAVAQIAERFSEYGKNAVAPQRILFPVKLVRAERVSRQNNWQYPLMRISFIRPRGWDARRSSRH